MRAALLAAVLLLLAAAPAPARALTVVDMLGREVRLDVKVDPSIIGGLVLQFGDSLIDASVATRLQQLRRRLSSS